MTERAQSTSSKRLMQSAILLATLLGGCKNAKDTVTGPPESVRIWVGGEVHLGGTGTDRLDLLDEHTAYGKGVINLVGPLHVDSDDARAVVERADGKVLLQNGPLIPQALVNNGVRVVGVANDHALDLGSESAGQTMAVLKMRGLTTAGGPAGPAKYMDGNIRIAITQHHLPPGPLNPDVPESLAAAANDAEFHLATFHVAKWDDGAPAPAALTAAIDAAIAAGADAIAAHGGQRIGHLERRGQVPIAWNLGPLATDRPDDTPTESALLRLHRRPDGVVDSAVVILQAGISGDHARVHSEPAEIVARLTQDGASLIQTSEEAVYSF